MDHAAATEHEDLPVGTAGDAARAIVQRQPARCPWTIDAQTSRAGVGQEAGTGRFQRDVHGQEAALADAVEVPQRCSADERAGRVESNQLAGSEVQIFDAARDGVQCFQIVRRSELPVLPDQWLQVGKWGPTR